jgi:hypothetical protein
MSVQTTADADYDLLKEKLKEISNQLRVCESLIDEMVNPITWGGSGWKKEFTNSVISLQNSSTEFRSTIRLFIREWE